MVRRACRCLTGRLILLKYITHNTDSRVQSLRLRAPCSPTLLSFSPDGLLLAAGLADGTAVVWDLQGSLGQPVMFPPHKGEVCVWGGGRGALGEG